MSKDGAVERDILEGLLIPYNLTVDLTMGGDCHAKPDKDLHESYDAVLRVAAKHGAAAERERCAVIAESFAAGVPPDAILGEGKRIAGAIRKGEDFNAVCDRNAVAFREGK